MDILGKLLQIKHFYNLNIIFHCNVFVTVVFNPEKFKLHKIVKIKKVLTE